MIVKTADMFPGQIKWIGSSGTVSCCSAYKMRDCSRTLQLDSSSMDVVYPIANGVTEPLQIFAVVKWCLENICHLLLANRNTCSSLQKLFIPGKCLVKIAPKHVSFILV